MRKSILSIFILFQLLTCALLATQEVIFDQNLQSEFLGMCEKEQALRELWVNTKDPIAKEEWRQKVIEIDLVHLTRLKEVTRDFGWPGYALVGSEGSHAFWLLVQHTPDYVFQHACLDLLEQAVLNQDASMIDLAYLKDRVYVHEEKKQIYGTQLYGNDIGDLHFYPIEDEDHVNERRAAIGLPSLEEYLAMIMEIYRGFS